MTVNSAAMIYMLLKQIKDSLPKILTQSVYEFNKCITDLLKKLAVKIDGWTKV